MPFVSAVFLAVSLGVLSGWALERRKFWPWPIVDAAVEAAKSLRQFGAIIPHGRRMLAPAQASRERFTIHDASRMHGGYYAFAGWDDAAQSYGAWLYDASGRLLHRWPLRYSRLDTAEVRAKDDSPHGFVVLRDGSVVANFDDRHLMGRFDGCGAPVWKRAGVFHHQISQAEDGSLWSWRGDDVTAYGHYQYLENFDAETGAKIREVGLIEDILRSDPQASILLGVRQGFRFQKLDSEPEERWAYDLFHPNDVEVLSTALAPKFPMFSAGDLLVSIRVINLVAVLDGVDFHFKWWSHGPWIGQHDADFTEDGLISVFDNNTERDLSEIVRMDPATRAVKALPSVPDSVFRSRYMGVHQYLPDGNVLIVVPGEGRALERSPAGRKVMEFNNVPTPGSRFNDHIENGVWLPDGYFTALPTCGGRTS